MCWQPTQQTAIWRGVAPGALLTIDTPGSHFAKRWPPWTRQRRARGYDPASLPLRIAAGASKIGIPFCTG